MEQIHGKRGIYFFGQYIFNALDLYPLSTWVVSGDYNAIIDRSDVENGTGFNHKNCHTLSDLAGVDPEISGGRG